MVSLRANFCYNRSFLEPGARKRPPRKPLPDVPTPKLALNYFISAALIANGRRSDMIWSTVADLVFWPSARLF